RAAIASRQRSHVAPHAAAPLRSLNASRATAPGAQHRLRGIPQVALALTATGKCAEDPLNCMS
ncbi:MAG TPA: hypothetical protein VIK70_04605, partial [Lysobacter sp.]